VTTSTTTTPTGVRTFERIWREADAAGKAAAKAAVPDAIVVYSPKSLFDNEPDLSKPVYYEPEGMCGFASVRFAGNTAFGRWAKKTGRADTAYPKGLMHWVSDYGQSYDRKRAYAQAFATVLREAGIDCYAESRLD
jgi:hypothetical protein